MNLKGFPRRTLRGDRLLYRLHRRAHGPWWFSADGGGRFDPVGSGLGACYLAYAPLGAWVEVFRKTMLLAEAEIADRSLSEVTTGRDVRLADLLSRRALAFGVTASLGADEDYSGSQQFAAAVVDAGFDGVRYLARHDPAQRLVSVALFARPGSPDSADPVWRAGLTEPIPDALVTEAARTFGYRQLPVP